MLLDLLFYIRYLRFYVHPFPFYFFFFVIVGVHATQSWTHPVSSSFVFTHFLDSWLLRGLSVVGRNLSCSLVFLVVQFVPPQICSDYRPYVSRGISSTLDLIRSTILESFDWSDPREGWVRTCDLIRRLLWQFHFVSSLLSLLPSLPSLFLSLLFLDSPSFRIFQ